jgi:hypothetical protein
MEDYHVKVIVQPVKRSWKQILLQVIEWSTKIAEFIVGIQLILFGIWLLFSYETFSIPMYQYMAMTASETSWGVSFLVVGILQVIGLFLPETFPKGIWSLWWRRGMCFGGSVLFGIVAINAARYNFYTLSVPCFGSMAAIEMLIFWKLMTKRDTYA